MRIYQFDIVGRAPMQMHNDCHSSAAIALPSSQGSTTSRQENPVGNADKLRTNMDAAEYKHLVFVFEEGFHGS
jgi:hypothetical protein